MRTKIHQFFHTAFIHLHHLEYIIMLKRHEFATLFYLGYLCNSNTKNNIKMEETPNCPVCSMENTYFDGTTFACPDCFHEWTGEANTETEDTTPRDSNGAELLDGDAVTVIKDLKVKGSSMVIKRGTKVKSIRLTEEPTEVDCKIDGSSIVLKTCFLKKG